MDIRIIEKKDKTMKFILSEVDVALANSLRRAILSEVPTFAIEDVVIIENTSPLFDEIIAHRLGLIPLTTDLETYSYSEECESGNPDAVSQCQVTLTLEKEAGNDYVTVYSGDLESEDPNIHPVYDKIPITKLAPGQKIVIEATARLGVGRIHAKWQPVSSVGYKYMPLIKVYHDKCDLCGACVSACPRNILEIRDNALIIKNAIDCILCKACVDACGEKQAIDIEWDKSSFIFQLESTGALPVEKIVDIASQIIIDQTNEILKKFESAKEVAK